MTTQQPARAWQRTDLTLPEYAAPTEPPSICDLIYTGKRHAISGPPETSKTLLTLIIGLTHIRQTPEETFALIDFEMGGNATRLLLQDLGATLNEIARVYYVEASQQPELADITDLEAANVTLAIIDAAAGAYHASDLDDNKRQDAEIFSRRWIQPLWMRGITTILLDHVVKNTETRGRYAIGSERKLGGVDIHLGLETIKQLHRGHNGLIKITTHKDRPAHLPRPTAATLELTSDPDTHQIGWTFKPAQSTDELTAFRPTALMEKVSRWLEEQTEPATRNNIIRTVKGKDDYVAQALDTLTDEGYIDETDGPKQGRHYTRLYEHKRAYREALDDYQNTFSPPMVEPNKLPYQTKNQLTNGKTTLEGFSPVQPEFSPAELPRGSAVQPPPYGGQAEAEPNQNTQVQPDPDSDIPW